MIIRAISTHRTALRERGLRCARALVSSKSGVASRPPLSGGIGLSTVHISPTRELTCEIAKDAAWLRLRQAPTLAPQGPPRHTVVARGRVSAFSRRSRSRLIQRLVQTPRSRARAGILFVTLTYPGEWAGDPAVWKRDLDAFLKRLKRLRGAASGYWKLEPQGRGAPHYHLLLFSAGYLDHEWVARTWYEIVGSHDARHLRAGTRVEAVRASHLAGAYCAKYAGKAVEGPSKWPEFPGRYWGIFGRSELGIVIISAVLSPQVWHAARRVCLRLLRARMHTHTRRQSGRPDGIVPGQGLGCWLILDDLTASRLLEVLAKA